MTISSARGAPAASNSTSWSSGIPRNTVSASERVASKRLPNVVSVASSCTTRFAPTGMTVGVAVCPPRPFNPLSWPVGS